MSHLTIEKDIEYIKNQVNYLDTFQQRISKALKELKSGSSWKGISSDEQIYVAINRWLKSYTLLKNHLYQKDVIDIQLKKSLNKLPQLVFSKPLSTKEYLKQKSAFTKLMYAAIPPYRTGFNRKRVKEIELQLLEYKEWGEKLKKLSFKIESVYTDGI
jgi:aminopeptidase C